MIPIAAWSFPTPPAGSLLDYYPLFLLILFVAWLGACFGSFSNVLIYRLPRNLSVVGPRSFCPGCKKQVAWFDNIPVLSWLLLRARCRHCSAPISGRYVLVELAGVCCALVAVARFGWTIDALAAGIFLTLLLNIAIIDWGHMIIPHTLTISGMVCGVLLSSFGTRGLVSSLVGLALGAGIILAVSYGYKLVRGVVGMGGGDVMMMAMVGAFLGKWGVLGVLFGGALMGSLYAISFGRGKVDGTAKLPFGTFLAAASAIVLLFGSHISNWYLAIL